MNRSMLLGAAVLSVCALAAANPAEARRATVVAGVIGGLSAGAIAAGAGYPYDAYPSFGYGFDPGAAGYYGPPPGCVVRQQRVWDGHAWRSRRIRVCY